MEIITQLPIINKNETALDKLDIVKISEEYIEINNKIKNNMDVANELLTGAGQQLGFIEEPMERLMYLKTFVDMNNTINDSAKRISANYKELAQILEMVDKSKPKNQIQNNQTDMGMVKSEATTTADVIKRINGGAD